MRRFVIILLSVVFLAGCAGHVAGSKKAESREFPSVKAPDFITDKVERADYITEHFWDGFFSGNGPTDTGKVLGVVNSDIEKNVIIYLGYLDFLPMSKAQDRIKGLFNQIESTHARDTTAHVYQLMTALLSMYLYDPNSPLRSEDLYLPFVEGMAASQYTTPQARPGYVFQEQKCRLNQFGQKAPDFKFKDLRGAVHSLYGIKAGYTILFFSNPGCENCLEIINELKSQGDIDARIEAGSLAIVNIYIDEELEKWKAYAPNYPVNWHNGYDPSGIIRSDELYYVRAIPSLYLLDADKRVILKDAPIERVLAVIENSN